MEALQVDSSQVLREAVFSVQTNYVFQKMLMNVNKNYRKQFVRLLRVNVQTVEPIYFNGKKYVTKDHKNNIFLFIDRDFKLIGILKGSVWDKVYENYERYDRVRSWNQNDKYIVVKNRPNMTEKAAHILMITPEMQVSFKKRHPSKPAPRFIDSRAAYKSLQRRLDKYKLKKHRSLTDQDVMNKTKELIILLTNHLFDKDIEKELVDKRPKSRSSWNNTLPDVIKDVTELAKDYWDRYQRSQRGGHEAEWNKEYLAGIKIELINYFNAYLNEEE